MSSRFEEEKIINRDEINKKVLIKSCDEITNCILNIPKKFDDEKKH